MVDESTARGCKYGVMFFYYLYRSPLAVGEGYVPDAESVEWVAELMEFLRVQYCESFDPPEMANRLAALYDNKEPRSTLLLLLGRLENIYWRDYVGEPCHGDCGAQGCLVFVLAEWVCQAWNNAEYLELAHALAHDWGRAPSDELAPQYLERLQDAAPFELWCTVAMLATYLCEELASASDLSPNELVRDLLAR